MLRIYLVIERFSLFGESAFALGFVALKGESLGFYFKDLVGLLRGELAASCTVIHSFLVKLYR